MFALRMRVSISAIGSVSPVIKAKDSDKVIAITIVNVTGTILMILLPLITSILYNNDVLQSSALMGGILQSVGQVIGSAKFIGDPVVELATVFKIIRIGDYLKLLQYDSYV